MKVVFHLREPHHVAKCEIPLLDDYHDVPNLKYIRVKWNGSMHSITLLKKCLQTLDVIQVTQAEHVELLLLVQALGIDLARYHGICLRNVMIIH